jgi:FixJ family two-component response regulator
VPEDFIAIVDDDDDLRLSLDGMLASLGYAVRPYASAESFLASLSHGQPACLISDVQMPGMNGLELLRRVVASGLGLPVILITAYPDQTLRQHAAAAGGHCFLSKPFEEEALVSCLESAMRQRGA